MNKYSNHYEETVFINVISEKIFAFADNHHNFSSHMNKSSWMMGGGKMEIQIDEGEGQKIGSHIKMSGKVFGVSLFLDEVIIERTPPSQKVWETVGKPKLLVIGPYRLGFEISPTDKGSSLRVFIDYDLPQSLSSKWLGFLFGGIYAKWCVRQMTQGVQERFK